MIAEIAEQVRSAVTPKSIDNGAKLEKALVELRTIEARRLELIEWDKAEGEAAQELFNELQAEMGSVAVSRDGDLDTFRRSYRDWLRKQLELTPRIEALRQRMVGLTRRDTLARADDQGGVVKLKTEFPQLKQLLADAICAKAGQLQTDADRIARDEQARLDREHGVGEYSASDSPVVSRAKSNAEYVKRLVERAKTEPAESLYLDVVRYLLR